MLRTGCYIVIHSMLQQIVARGDLDIFSFLQHIRAQVIVADSVQTEYCPTFPLSVRVFVTGVTSHISHIYKGINAMLIIKPYTF